MCIYIYYTHTHTHTHTHTEYYSTIKKNQIVPFVTTWMDLGSIILKEISQRKTSPYDLTYMWNVKHQRSKTKQRRTYRYKEQIGGLWGGGGVGKRYPLARKGILFGGPAMQKSLDTRRR